MKVGMIFECVPNGPDQQVCEYLAKKLLPDIELARSATLLNKPGVLSRCGVAAQNMLHAENCDRVIIVWDYRPSDWGSEYKVGPDEEKFCLKRDRNIIFTALRTAGVDITRVYLVCINAMLETWLLADNGALHEVIASISRNKVTIPSFRDFHKFPDPKGNLDRTFRDNTGNRRPYRAEFHAIQIVKAMGDLSELQKVETFVRFAEKVTGLSRENLFPKATFPCRYLPSWDR